MISIFMLIFSHPFNFLLKGHWLVFWKLTSVFYNHWFNAFLVWKFLSVIITSPVAHFFYMAQSLEFVFFLNFVSSLVCWTFFIQASFVEINLLLLKTCIRNIFNLLHQDLQVVKLKSFLHYYGRHNEFVDCYGWRRICSNC